MYKELLVVGVKCEIKTATIKYNVKDILQIKQIGSREVIILYV